jgi:hypothetical protein
LSGLYLIRKVKRFRLKNLMTGRLPSRFILRAMGLAAVLSDKPNSVIETKTESLVRIKAITGWTVFHQLFRPKWLSKVLMRRNVFYSSVVYIATTSGAAKCYFRDITLCPPRAYLEIGCQMFNPFG